MTEVQKAIKAISGLVDASEDSETKQSLRLAVDILSKTRHVTWVCNDCTAHMLHCEYYNLDPSVYEVACSQCGTMYHIIPNKTLYDVAVVEVQS